MLLGVRFLMCLAQICWAHKALQSFMMWLCEIFAGIVITSESFIRFTPPIGIIAACELMIFYARNENM